MNTSHMIVDSQTVWETFHADPADMGLASNASDMIASFRSLDRDCATWTVLDIVLFGPFLIHIIMALIAVIVVFLGVALWANDD